MYRRPARHDFDLELQMLCSPSRLDDSDPRTRGAHVAARHDRFRHHVGLPMTVPSIQLGLSPQPMPRAIVVDQRFGVVGPS